jgi:non-ribosomal peptide synthetase component F
MRLSSQSTSALRLLAERQGTTMHTVLLAAFQTLLFRYTGQDEVLISCPVAARPDSAVHEVVACMTNMLVVRAQGRGNPSFGDLLQRVRAGWIEVLAHQDLPFEKIRRRLLKEAGTDDPRGSVVQVFFDYQSPESGRSASLPVSTMAGLIIGDDGPASSFGGLMLEPLFSGASLSPFEISLSLAEIDGALAIKWTYQTDIFSADTISRMAQVPSSLPHVLSVTSNEMC